MFVYAGVFQKLVNENALVEKIGFAVVQAELVGIGSQTAKLASHVPNTNIPPNCPFTI